jgi:hypothetical protein
MWILKSALLGMWLFGFGTMAFLYFAIYRNLPPNSSVDYRLITRYTIENPVWWAALAGCLALGYAVVPYVGSEIKTSEPRSLTAEMGTSPNMFG